MANKNWFAKIFDRIGAPTGASIAADIAATKSENRDVAPSLITIASDNLKHRTMPVGEWHYTPTGAYGLTLEMTALRNMAGVRVKHSVEVFPTATVLSRIYVNDVAVGAIHTSTLPGPTQYSDNIAGIITGDKIQVYSVSAAPGGVIEDLQLCYDFTIETAVGLAAKTSELISGAAVDFGAVAKVSIQTAAQAAITASALATAALVATTRTGNPQVKATTVDTHSLLGAIVAATCATQEIIIDSVIFSPHDDLSGVVTFTGISIETDDTTVQTLISQANGVKVNLTAYSQLSWTGAIRLRVGKKITVTTYGAVTTANPSTCDVRITYHAVVDGGTL